jgi:hypothetical protein
MEASREAGTYLCHSFVFINQEADGEDRSRKKRFWREFYLYIGES